MDNNCIFCKIISNEIQSASIYEDNEFKVILDKFPASIGHVLIIPKTHFESIFEIDSEIAGRLFKLAVKIANNMKNKLNLTSMNVLQNNGAIAGQTVNHFHMHLIPRYDNDKVNIHWEHLTINDKELTEIQKELNLQ